MKDFESAEKALQNATDLLLLMPQFGEDNSFLNSHCGVTDEWKEPQENGVIEHPGMNAQWFCDLCHMNNVPCKCDDFGGPTDPPPRSTVKHAECGFDCDMWRVCVVCV